MRGQLRYAVVDVQAKAAFARIPSNAHVRFRIAAYKVPLVLLHPLHSGPFFLFRGQILWAHDWFTSMSRF